MGLLLDTHILVWWVTEDKRLSLTVRNAMTAPDEDLYVSAVNAYEFIHLEALGRFAPGVHFRPICHALEITPLDFPAAAANLVPLLPDVHRDPIDRMLIAHALHADLTLVTSNAIIREYPVRSLW